jgi:hypothetical protein
MASGYQFVSGAHNRYVDPAADGTRDGTSPTNGGAGVGPWTMAQALTAGAGTALDVWVKSGDYTIGATTVTLGGSGGAQHGRRLMGYATVPGDLVTPCSPLNPRLLPTAGLTSGNWLTGSASQLVIANLTVDASGRTVEPIRFTGTVTLVGCVVLASSITTVHVAACIAMNQPGSIVDRCIAMGNDTAISAARVVNSLAVAEWVGVGARSGTSTANVVTSIACGRSVCAFELNVPQITGVLSWGPDLISGNSHGSAGAFRDVLHVGNLASASSAGSPAVAITPGHTFRRLRGTGTVNAAFTGNLDKPTQVTNPFSNFNHSATPDLRLNAAGRLDPQTLRLMYDLRDVPLPAGSLRDSPAELEAWLAAALGGATGSASSAFAPAIR